ncbi:hypothetical protein [Cereibacter johrii]|uniref:hypothetical protein n=1 Tax=Cereibacter johrii TaxID=445629 RepID=UPI00167EC72A|nr:hypothetical protein [Cereibacter johrii]
MNKLDVGAESIDRDGYVKICVAEPNRWTSAPTHMAFKHRWLWEKNGKSSIAAAIIVTAAKGIGTGPRS